MYNSFKLSNKNKKKAGNFCPKNGLLSHITPAMRITPAEHRTIAAECGKGFRSTEDSDDLPLLHCWMVVIFDRRARFDTWVVVSSSCFQFHVEVFGSVVINYYNNNTIHTHTAPCKITVTKPKCGEQNLVICLDCISASKHQLLEKFKVFLHWFSHLLLLQLKDFSSSPAKYWAIFLSFGIWASQQLSSNFIRRLSSQLSRLQRKSRWVWFQPRSLQSFRGVDVNTGKTVEEICTPKSPADMIW